MTKLKSVVFSISANLSAVSVPSSSAIVVNFASPAPRESFLFTEAAVTGLKLEPSLSDTMLATSSIITLLRVPLAAFLSHLFDLENISQGSNVFLKKGKIH